MSIEAMKLALEALEKCLDWPGAYEESSRAVHALRHAIEQAQPEQCTYPNCDYPCMNLPDCKESLAQPSSKHEPLGFMNAGHAYELQRKRITYGYVYSKKQKGASIPLYTFPPPRQPEPVIDKAAAIRIATALGWTPPRQWVGLTDEEIDNINYTSAHMLAREVEAKLKQKNGYAKENT